MPAISAAPTTWRPAFVGGPTLGSHLDLMTLRKVQILFYWLALIFPGAVIQLVQGSPSGSDKSGGTHRGPGDAGDLYILLNSRPAPVGVYIIASLILRLLGCAAYVRGQDVNGDGRKDDTFEAHLHFIDREGINKVQAAIDQINLYLRHLNGLVGNHPDLEQLVTNPIWLADYTDVLFRQRFMALTSAAATLAVHTEPAPVPEEDDMDLPELVRAAYRHHFGRDALADEVDRHVLAAVRAGTTPAALYNSLATSPEATDQKVRHDRIAGYYLTYLGRPGAETVAEIGGWVSGGKPLGEIRELIEFSTEGQQHAAQKTGV